MSEASILFAVGDRPSLWRRTLYALSRRPPHFPFEVVVASRHQSALDELRLYSSAFHWRFVRLDPAGFEKETGVRPVDDRPWGLNAAAGCSRSPNLIIQGDDVIVWGDAYDALLADFRGGIALGATYDLPDHRLLRLDSHGMNLSAKAVADCQDRPLCTPLFPTDAARFLSVIDREAFGGTGGFDERFVASGGGFDRDFLRRSAAGEPGGVPLLRTGATALWQSPPRFRWVPDGPAELPAPNPTLPWTHPPGAVGVREECSNVADR